MRITKLSFLILCLLLVAILVYYFIIVMNARAETPEMVTNALNSEEAQLELDDLTDQQLDALLKIQDPNFHHHNGFDISTPGAANFYSSTWL